jgi:hypothetical protein
MNPNVELFGKLFFQPIVLVECPATFVPVEMRQTGMRGTGYGTREEAYGGADRESAATG